MAEEMRVLEEDLTCAVCLDLYRDPHLLPCGHNFCISCLQQLKSNSEHSRLRCPECRQTHHCSVSWQKNFKLASIANGYRCRSKPQVPSCKSVKVPCDYCPPGAADTAEESVSVKTCLKCDVSMCLEHVKPHLELPTFREHPLVEPLGNIKLRKCAEHDEMFRYYCLDERVFLCYACTIEGGHKEHRIKTLKNAMQDLKASLGKQLQKADKQIRRVEKTMQRQKEVEHENKAFLEEADRKFHALRDALSSRLESLLVSLQGCVHGSQAGSDHSVQQNLARITVDRSRLDEAGFPRVLKKS